MSSAGPGRREVAHRVFAAEYDDATLEYAESDEERAPNYVVTPSGTRINRLFVVGVLTAVEQVNDDTIRARIADPTGAFVVYAGQYQPDELAALQSLEAPAFVAVTGKANTFSPEGSDRVLTSVRPESVTEVDAETRDRWVTATAEHTLARIQTAAGALGKDERGDALRVALLRDDVDPGFAEGIARAIDHYDTTADYLGALRDLAVQSLEVVAGERSEVEALEHEPDAGDGAVTAADLAELLGDDRRAVTRAAGDVDVDALVGDDGPEPTAAESTDADSEATESVDEEPATQETADSDVDSSETTASPADEAAESGTDGTEAHSADDGEESADPEPETSETAVAETAAEAEEAADTKESEVEESEAEESDTAASVSDETPSEPEPETSETAAEEPAENAEQAAGDEIYEFDEEEREQIEEEHGVEFQSGTEVDPAGEADIDTEDAPPGADDSDEASPDASDESEGGADEADGAGDEEEAAADGDDGSGDESDDADSDVDLEAILVEEMDALDDGDGADRAALIDAVAEETGADADAIDDAIDDLLMSGQCYEPSEGTLKPI
ncbi:hypothetical protein GCM10028857_10770 [Salinarchaeum chitinilyticum]